MLTDLREKSQSFLVYILFGILIFVFIFFFGPQADGLMQGQTRPVDPNDWAVQVNGEEIPVREIEVSVRRYERSPFLRVRIKDLVPKLRQAALSKSPTRRVSPQTQPKWVSLSAMTR